MLLRLVSLTLQYKMKGESNNMEGRRFDNRNDRSGGRNNFSSGPRTMHKATCSGCKQECEVPFKPTEGRDVFCQDCFKKNNPRN